MPKPKSKVKRIIPLATAMALCVLAYPAYAAVYDLQPYTRCIDGVCNTTVDVGTLGLSAQKISNLKTVNITNFLTKSGIISNFSYFWSGNTVSITGTVNDNVYWSFGAGTDRFDPWWNTSSATNATFNQSSTSPFSNTAAYGPKFTAKIDFKVIEIKKAAACTGTNVRIKDLNGTTVVNVTFTGDTATMDAPIMKDHTYCIYIDKNGASYTAAAGTPTYPANSNPAFMFNVTTSCREGFSDDGADSLNFGSMIGQNSSITSLWYETGLFLNGTQANRSVLVNEKVNITSQTNLTGLNVTVYDNGALIGFNLTRYENTNNYSAGTHNITSAYYNASVNSTLTWWLTVVGINPVNTIACFKTRNVCVDTMTNRVFLRGNPL